MLRFTLGGEEKQNEVATACKRFDIRVFWYRISLAQTFYAYKTDRITGTYLEIKSVNIKYIFQWMWVVCMQVRSISIFRGLIQIIVVGDQFLLCIIINPDYHLKVFAEKREGKQVNEIKRGMLWRITRWDCTFASLLVSNSYSLTGTFASCNSYWNVSETVFFCIKQMNQEVNDVFA